MQAVAVVPEAEPAAAADEPTRDLSSVAAAMVVFLSLTTLVITRFDTRPGRDYQLHTFLFASDLALLVLVLTRVRGFVDVVRSWRRHACTLSALVVGLLLVPGFLVHPSDRGAAALLRGVAAVALGLSLASARKDGRRLIVGALAAVTLIHIVVALTQRARNGSAGLESIGELALVQVGGRLAPSGLAVHPYVLGAWCAVAGTALLVLARLRGSGWPLVRAVGVVAFLGIGLSLGRSGAVAGILVMGALLWSARASPDRTWRRTVLAVGVALVVGVLLSFSGWVSRAGQTTAGGAEVISSGRLLFLRQARMLFAEDPLTGVGPGRYVIVLSERIGHDPLVAPSPYPVHAVPALLVVEGGVVVVPGLLLLTLAVGRACRRGGIAAVALTLAMVPFLLLDHLPWSYPQGLVLTGLWLGALDLLSRRDDDPAGAEAPTTGGPPVATEPSPA